MIRAAADPGLQNTFLHAPTAPAVTQRQLIEAFAAAAGVPTPKLASIPAWLLKGLGVVPGQMMRELAETSYMLARPFELDSSRSEERLGLSPKAFEVAVKSTVDWWRNEAVA